MGAKSKKADKSKKSKKTDSSHSAPKEGGIEMSAKVRPLHDRVLVKRLEEEDQKTSGGIIIPDTAREKPQKGEIVSVGEGKIGDDGKRIKLDVKAGDRILFGKYSGNEIKVNGTEYMIMREDDVYAILED
jgi:chaperonin GroES